MSQEIAKELAKLGKEIELAKNQLAQQEGRREEMLARLKEDFDIETLAEAKELLEKWEGTAKALDEKISTEFEKLRENFVW